MSVLNQYRDIVKDVNATALECGRDPAEINLIAVTKHVCWNKVELIYEAGQRDFGENRLLEGVEKKLLAPNDCRWHFIGSLQKNKVRKVIENFDIIHSVDSFELAKKISECSQEGLFTTRILLQSNTSGESTKQGYTPAKWKECFEDVLKLPCISIDGLMTMAPLTEDEKVIHECFGSLRLLREQLKEMAGGRASLYELSMGMSHDYRIAISEGATLLRIGSAIFKNSM